jgi:hypothetical protein
MDGRIYPEIPFLIIILCIISMPLLRIDSLLQLDLKSRDDFLKSLFGLKRRKMVVSDSALTNTLKKMYRKSPRRLGGIIELLYECYQELPSKNFIIEGMRILCIDGSTFSKHFGVALFVLGQKFDYLL